MSLALSALLCLGLCLGHRMRAQADKLPRPSLRAENGTLAPLGRRVTFRCRGSPEAAEYFLEKELGSGFQPINSKLSQEVEVEFSIPRVALYHAGTYSCSYRKASLLSELSDPLELVVTGTSKDAPLPHSPGGTQALTPSPPSEEPGTLSTGPAARDYMVGNVIRLSLAGLVLVLLGVLLAEAWNSSRGRPGGLPHLLTEEKAGLGGPEGADPKDSRSPAHTQTEEGPSMWGVYTSLIIGWRVSTPSPSRVRQEQTT